MTLPTRPDGGGIDWEKYAQENSGRVGSMNSAIRMCREAAAHTRERCARWHDEQELSYLRSRDKFSDKGLSWDNLDRMATEHRKSAAALRKMED